MDEFDNPNNSTTEVEYASGPSAVLFGLLLIAIVAIVLYTWFKFCFWASSNIVTAMMPGDRNAHYHLTSMQSDLPLSEIFVDEPVSTERPRRGSRH